MKSQTLYLRRTHALKKGINLIKMGESTRDAAQKVGIAHSTLCREHREVSAALPVGRVGRLPHLQPQEEQAVVDLIIYNGIRRIPLDRNLFAKRSQL